MDDSPIYCKRILNNLKTLFSLQLQLPSSISKTHYSHPYSSLFSILDLLATDFRRNSSHSNSSGSLPHTKSIPFILCITYCRDQGKKNCPYSGKLREDCRLPSTKRLRGALDIWKKWKKMVYARSSSSIWENHRLDHQKENSRIKRQNMMTVLMGQCLWENRAGEGWRHENTFNFERDENVGSKALYYNHFSNRLVNIENLHNVNQ